jgi:uncharacterized protein with PQ loop repeat
MLKTRSLLFIITILILSVSIFTFVFYQHNFLIRQWNITLDPPGFHDSRQYAWASESFAQGYDPLIKNPNNPAGHQLNYPRIWHVFFHLGVNESHTNIIGSIVVLLFFAGVGIFWFSKQYDSITYFALSIGVLSPATMLGINRSNIELILFLVVAVAIAVSYRSTITSLAVLLFGSVLKLYPIFGTIYLLRENQKKFWLLTLAALGIFILYGALSINDFRQIFNTTPKLVNSSHGINVWWMGLRHPRVFAIPLSESAVFIFQVTTYIIACLLIGTALFLSTCKIIPKHLRQGEHLDAFRTGAGIYIGCFLLMNTHDYRLIFLIFTIPQLIAWSKNNNGKQLSLPVITLAAMGVSLWSFFIMRFLGRPATFVIEEFSNWVMLYTLLYLLFASAPDWLLNYIKRPLSFIGCSKRQ